MSSRISFDIIAAWGGRWRATIFVDGFQVATKAFETYWAAKTWVLSKQAELTAEIRER